MSSVFLFLFLTLLQSCLSTFTIDLSQRNKYDNATLESTLCNKDTLIDFSFNEETVLNCSGSSCSVTKQNQSGLTFLDVEGQDLDLTLSSGEFTSHTFIQGQTSLAFAFTFVDETNDKTVYVIIPVQFTASTMNYVLDVNKLIDGYSTDSFDTFGQIEIKSGGISLSLDAFYFLNNMDIGHFYHVTNSKKDEIVLLSAWTYYLSTDISSAAVSSSLPTFTLSYETTGDKLCYGSQPIFQTHMRESYPLWTAWFAILFFWLYYLLTETHPIDCYDKKFENNKWTSWAFYSLHYLGHDQYFSKLSRISLMLLNFSWQAVVLAAVYMTLGPSTDEAIIIWAALIALGASQPVPYIMGGTFLKYIRETTLEKFHIMKKAKGVVLQNSKEAESDFEKEIDEKQQRLYGLYYWYYVLIFIFFVTFWTLSVHLMQQLHRDYYYLHGYWLASLGITFVLEYFVLDVIFSALLGLSACYQVRGFYYHFELGQEWKEIEE